jgi:hypothetical protein
MRPTWISGAPAQRNQRSLASGLPNHRLAGLTRGSVWRFDSTRFALLRGTAMTLPIGMH